MNVPYDTTDPETDAATAILVKQFENLVDEYFCLLFWHVVHVNYLLLVQNTRWTHRYKSTETNFTCYR